MSLRLDVSSLPSLSSRIEEDNIGDYESDGTSGASFSTLLSPLTPLTPWTSFSPVKLPRGRGRFSRDTEDRSPSLEVGRGPRFDHDWPSTISQRIEDVAFTRLDAWAIRDSSGRHVNYRDMMSRVHDIGSALVHAGARPGSIVAVLCEPTAEYIFSLLAILRLGAVYVPLDNLQPIARLAVIARDCRPDVIICEESTKSHVSALDVSAPVINASSVAASQQEVPIDTSYAGVACVLYSSGTTGTPKGIMLSQTNAMNQFAGWHSIFHHSEERILQQAALGFDVSLFQVLYALTYGGCIILANKHIRGQPVELAKFMLREQVTYTVAVCSEYVALLRYGGELLKQCISWRYAFSGGERLTAGLKAQFRSVGLKGLRLINMYGPTELAYCSAYGIVPYHDEDIWEDTHGNRVGGAFPNYRHYICDEHLQPLPPGVPGEICVGGAGVGLGYLNPEQSAEKFLFDRFATDEELERGYNRLYRSGDKGQLLEDGTLMFLGRMEGDAQAKLNGVRIDLDDLAQTILKAARGVLVEAAVTVRGVIDPFTVAFAVFQDRTPPDQAGRFLKDLLTNLPVPLNMRPAIIAPLESMPLNINGKVDRKALAAMPLPQRPTSRSQEQEQLTVPEKQLKDLWQSILSDGHLGMHITKDTDFFEAGGNSMLLVKLQALMSEVFGAFVPLVQLFEFSTLEGMAAHLVTKSGEPARFKTIDWAGEIESALHELSPGPVVLLVGADNFIGQSLLQTLAADDGVREIHCLAGATPDPQTTADDAAILSSKITTHVGSLSKPRLGLSTSEARCLADKASLIIHNGADFSFLKSYQTLRKTNFGSTIEVAKLALQRRVPIHYISTTSVAKLSTATAGDSATTNSAIPLGGGVAVGEPATDGSNGYIASRWASEQFLQHASRRHGLPVSIHRVAGVTSHTAPSTDLLNSLLKYSHLSKTVPDLSTWPGRFDYQPLEGVSREICQRALADLPAVGGAEKGEDYPAGTLATTRHYSSSLRVPARELAAHLSEDHGCTFTTLPLAEWVLSAERMGMDHMVASYLNSPRGATGEAVTVM